MRIQMLMRSLFAAFMIFAVVGCTKDEPTPTPDNPVEEKEPTVAIEISETTTNSVAFTISATDAQSITYMITEGTSVADAATAQ